MKGGKYLGEGTYGCSLDPAPKCYTDETEIAKGAKITKKLSIGKVMSKNESFQEEIEIAKALYKIDPKQKYLLYPQTHCYVKYEDTMKVPGASKCDTIRSDALMGMLKMTNGGITLEDYVKKRHITPYAFIKMMIHIARGVQLLNKKGFVHHDLKFNNILVNPTTRDAKIIDFGLMVKKSNIYTDGNRYLHSRYWLHPPEYRFFVHLERNDWKTPTAQDIRWLMTEDLRLNDHKFSSGDKVSMRHLLTNVPMFAFCEYENAVMAVFKAIEKRKTVYQKRDYFNGFVSKIDVYSLGISMLYMSTFLDYTGMVKEQYDMFITLLKMMVHPHVGKRWSITKAIKEMEKIIV